MVKRTVILNLLLSCCLNCAVLATEPNDYIIPGKSYMCEGSLSGLRLAYQTFDAGLKDSSCSQCSTSRELKFLHAATKTAMLFIDINDLSIQDSFLEVAEKFGVNVLGDFFEEIDVNVPLTNDHYKIPGSAPDPNEISNIVNNWITEINDIIADLNSISDSPSDRFRFFFEPNDTGLETNLEVDYGDLLVLKGLLLALKAQLEAKSAYDVFMNVDETLLHNFLYVNGIDVNDFNDSDCLELLHIINIDVNNPNQLSINNHFLTPYPDLLKVLPTANFPDVNGAAILAKAKADLIAAIDYYFDALNYIHSENDDGNDPQEDELLYIDPNVDCHLNVIKERLTLLRDSLVNGSNMLYPWEVARTYNVYDSNQALIGQLILDYDILGIAGGPGGESAFNPTIGIPSPWYVSEDFGLLSGCEIGIEFECDTEGWYQGHFDASFATDGSTFSDGDFEWWGWSEGSIHELSGQLVNTTVQNLNIDLNPIFGGTVTYPNPVNPRDLLPLFNKENIPIAGTVGHGLGNDPTLGGILPDMTQEDWAIALPSDDFNDNSMDTSMWSLYQESPNVWLDETNERLEIRSTADANGEVADYYANGWGFSTADNFSFRAYFHCSWPSAPEYSEFINILLGLVKGGVDPVTVRNNSVAIVAGYYVDGYEIEPYFHCGKFKNDGTYVVEGQKTRSQDNGILYISYDASKDELYLSDTGYWSANAWVTIPGLLKGEWGSAVVIPGLGSGYVQNVALDSDEAYLDNFVADSGTVVPNPANVLLSDNFNDNSINTSMWSFRQDSPNVWLDETNERLEVRSTEDVNFYGSGYFANGWGFSTTGNFSFKTDFHNLASGPPYSFDSATLGLEKDGSSRLFIEADYEPNHYPPSYFRYILTMAGSVVEGIDKARGSNDGTLYISYDASKDELYLSDTGYWSANAWVTIPGLLKGKWDSAVVMPYLACSAQNRALASGNVYFDNFVVDSGTIVPLLSGIYVDDNAPGDPGPGNPNISDPYENGTWEHPFDAIQEAINAAANGDTIIVKDGTYTGTGNYNINFHGKAITLRSQNGPANCIINCQQLGIGFEFSWGEGTDSIVDGFTITNGCLDDPEKGGGGICCYWSSPTITNCIITNCKAWRGGAIFCNNANPTITDCTITDNQALYDDGGGIYCWYGSPSITNCTISRNTSHYGGAGLGCYYASPQINNSTISYNTPDGIYTYNGTAAILGTVQVNSNSLNGNNGVLEIYAYATLETSDCNLSCNITHYAGNGTILVPAGTELTIENDAVVALADSETPDTKGTLQCNGMLRVKDNGNLLYANLNVARASFEDNAVISYNRITTTASSPYGQLLVKDTASITNNDIFAAGDRYIDLDPSTFTGTIQGNSISVKITEGTSKIPAGLFELRGYDINCPSPPCPSGISQLPEVPDFNLSTWTIDRMELVEGAKLILTNRADFQSPYNEGGEYEVLYVKHLKLGPNSVLDTALNRLYYETCEIDSTAEVKNTPLLGFSLGEINFDDPEQFTALVVHNNFMDPNPAPPDTTRIHVRRVEGLSPDPSGMLLMCNLRDLDPCSPTYEKIINARAKALFAKCTEEEILIRFKYLFNTAGPGTELAVYLSDVPELLPHNDPNDPMRNYHYIEVARIPPPPPGRPGSPGSGRFGVFQKTVQTEGLNISEGTYIEIELIEPQHEGNRSRLFSGVDTMLESESPPGGASAFLDSWSAEVHCDGICLDLSGDNVTDEVDFLTVVCGCGCSSELLSGGTGSYVCFEGPFSCDGYIDSYDITGWDWILNDETRTNFCHYGVPLSEDTESVSIETADLNASGETAPLGNPLGDLNDLLIAGKMGTNDGPTKLKDNLYVFNSSAQYVRSLSLASDRCNLRIVQDPNGQFYQINSETGVLRLDTSHTIIIPPKQITIPSNQTTLTTEPRYNKSATVYIGFKGVGSAAVGRPILDAAFDAYGYVYVVPVVVNPAGNEPPSYVAAAKLHLRPSENPPYKLITLYDDPPLPGDNQYHNNLREIEIDSVGNLYVINAHNLNESDALCRYNPNGAVEQHVNLAAQDINLYDPTGMYMSDATDMLYLASGQYNPEDSNSSIIYGFSTKGNLTLTRTITIQNMQLATSITEDPVTGSLWVVGFNMVIPVAPNPTQPPFYYPRLAMVPLGSNSVQAQPLSGAHDLAMPLSILWTKTVKCGGADIDKSKDINFVDFALLAGRWRNSSCAPPAWCSGADLNNSKIVDIMDVAILAWHWLETGCD
jgi:hypothetical protein